MTHLDPLESARRLPYSALVPAIARAATELVDGAIKAPERLVVPVANKGSLLCMPAVGSDIGITKIVTVHPNNAAHGLPVIQGEVVVFEASTGRRIMLLDGPTVTARRTAAVTLLAIETLAPSRPRSAVIIGTGVQAAAHAGALHDYFDLRALVVVGRDLARTTIFCAQLRATYPNMRPVPASPSSISAVCEASDVVIAATTSTTPVIPTRLPDATLAIGVGAFRPEMAELPPELLGTRRVVVDYLSGARHEAGDLLQAGIDWTRVTELSRHVAAKAPHMPTVFKSVGHASWDLAAARVAIEASSTNH